MKKLIRTIEIIIILLVFVQQAFSQQKKVVATIYHPVVGQTDDTPFITANNSVIDHVEPGRHRWLAVSRNLLEEGFILGTKVCIDNVGDGYNGDWLIMDVMNKRWTDKIDFLVDYSVKGGKWQNVTIEIISTIPVTPYYEKIYGEIKNPEREYLK